MCGIVAGISLKNIIPILLKGLKHLEYRGYDSCGLATIRRNRLTRFRSISRVEFLEQNITQERSLSGAIGIAHTRWATHGAPELKNTHPHFSHDTLAIVHNGIIENYKELKNSLINIGYEFESETDTEVVVHLIHSLYEGDLFSAFKKAVPLLEGAFAIAVMSKDEPEKLVAARKGAPLVLGVGDNENFVASDPLALSGVTDKFIYFDNDDIAEITPDHCQIYNYKEDIYNPVEREVVTIESQAQDLSLGQYSHFMEKEIYEQPQAVQYTIESLAGFLPEAFGFKAPAYFKRLKRVLILACGTSYYAGLTAKYWMEKIAKIPCEVEIASEYRYRISASDPETLVVVVSQSGETADTLAALQHAKAQGMNMTLAVCNVETSSMVKETGAHFITKAGPEIGVASTKAFTTQLIALYGLAVSISKVKTCIDSNSFLAELKQLQEVMEKTLTLKERLFKWAEDLVDIHDSIFLGRGHMFPIALEGALKLKEISYIHAEGYPAGELKHGPLALVDKHLPVFFVAPLNNLVDKVKSNIQEVRARQGKVYVLSNDPSFTDGSDENLHAIRMPDVPENLAPIVYALPFQLLAYLTATLKGTDVDKPRNLAKSVTVE